jgi:tetratricopeptide (TPR) repeat protein
MNTQSTVDAQLDAARTAERDGSWDEALVLYAGVLEQVRAAADAAGEAQVLRALARLCFERGDYDRSREYYEQSLARAQAAGDRSMVASALNGLAVVAQLRGQFDLAEPLYARAGVLADELNNLALAARIDQNLGTLANTRGDFPAALQRYGAALERFRTLEDHRAMAWVLNNMGMLHVDVGDWAAAELSFAAAFQHAERLDDWATQAKIDVNRAELYLKRQNYERAREHCDRAFRVFTRLASHIGLAEVHKFYGALYREISRNQISHLQFDLALRLARTCDNPLLEAETQSERARLFLNERQSRGALGSLNSAFAIFSELGAQREITDSQRRLQRLEESYYEAIQLWTDEEPVLRAQCGRVRGARVAHIIADLANASGLAETTELRLTAYVHAIGAALVPGDVPAGPGLPNADERVLLQQRAAAGADMLAELAFAPTVVAAVRHCHEHWDGSGGPGARAGDEIPLEARILGIAATFDMLTTGHADRPALKALQAVELMATTAGSVFDPAIFAAFRQLAVLRGERFGSQAVSVPT